MNRKMNDNFVFIDNIYRSRMTLLDILEGRGYEVDKYRKFSPAEATAAADAFSSLSFKVSKKDDESKVCDVRYAKISRPKLDTFFDDIEESSRGDLLATAEDLTSHPIVIFISITDFDHESIVISIYSE